MFKLREKETADKIVAKLKAMKLNIKLMHVCGTHQDTLVKFGLDGLFKSVGVEIIQGPGCPVCVTAPKEIEEIIELARAGKTVAVFGDMVRVPGISGSLDKVKSEGGSVKVIYGSMDAVRFAKESPDTDIVFPGIGFETTIPTTSSILEAGVPDNFYVISCHKLVPPALKALIIP